MGKLLSSYIFPHPPIIVPEIGRGEEEAALNTVNACKSASKAIKSKNPDTIVIITPHGPVFRDAVSISVNKTLKGSFSGFGRPDVSLEFNNDIELVEKIILKSRESEIALAELDRDIAVRFRIDTSIDHGALVPLYYISKEFTDFKIVHICMGFLSFKELFKFGMCIKSSIEELNRNVVVLASGDLSHRLIRGAPAGYDKRGREYDEKLVGYLKEADFESMMSIDKELIEAAGECGLRSFIIMSGCIDGYNVIPNMLSYEGPFGVGYCVAEFNISTG